MTDKEAALSITDHLARAREYIAKGDDYYVKAADEITAWLAEDESRTLQQAGDQLGRSKPWVSRLLRARNSGEAIEWGSGSNKRDEVAAKVLSDPDQRRQVLASLPAEQIDELISEANDVAVGRLHAKRAEHLERSQTTSDLMDRDDPFNPGEAWADTLIFRIHDNALKLSGHVAKWGLIVNAIGEEKAFAYLNETEQLVAEVRAALQERLHDNAEAR